MIKFLFKNILLLAVICIVVILTGVEYIYIDSYIELRNKQKVCIETADCYIDETMSSLEKVSGSYVKRYRNLYKYTVDNIEHTIIGYKEYSKEAEKGKIVTVMYEKDNPFNAYIPEELEYDMHKCKVEIIGVGIPLAIIYIWLFIKILRGFILTKMVIAGFRKPKQTAPIYVDGIEIGKPFDKN